MVNSHRRRPSVRLLSAVSVDYQCSAALIGDPRPFRCCAQELVVCNPSAPAFLLAEVELSAALHRRTALLILNLGYTDAQAAAVVRDLADGVRSQVETLLADRTTDLPAHLRGALIGLAHPLPERRAAAATVTALETPLAGAWRAHPAGRGR